MDKMSKIIKRSYYKCKVCGVEKYVPVISLYAWKFDGQFCCSYSCYRVLEKKYLEKNASPLPMDCRRNKSFIRLSGKHKI